MEYKKIQNKEYTLHLINSNRFKTINIVVFLTKKFIQEDIKYGSLLSSNMVYSTKKYNTKSKIAIIGEELYGANVTTSFGISGNSESYIFSLDFLNPKYTENKYMNETIDFLCEVLFNPNVKDNKFNEEYFNIIKNDAITRSKSIKDNPGLYASIEYSKIMYKGTPSENSTIPTIEDLNEVTSEKLYQKYNELFTGNYKIDIVVHGEIDDSIINIIEDKFKNIKGNNDKIELDIKHKYNNKLIEKIDTLPYNQSKLYVGYRLNNLSYHEMNHVLKVYNTILGTMNDSLLFNIVREEHSLCYTIGSYYSRYNPSLTIYAGINKTNYEKSVELIKECVNLMSDKTVVERLFDSSIKTINTYMNNYYDDVTSQINEYYKREFEKIETIEELKENINKVTIDEVINLNKKISLSTIYLLRGEL